MILGLNFISDMHSEQSSAQQSTAGFTVSLLAAIAVLAVLVGLLRNA